ncbi:4882_t:CDS:2, partial [Racocetra fulgida]
PLDLIPNIFGDIMSLRETNILLPDEFSGLERICLTANVQIIKNDSAPIYHQKLSASGNPILQRFEREVNLICENKIVCNAVSEVLIYDNEIVDLI